MRSQDKGMTLIEVSIALVILLIGVGFILNSDMVSHRYQNQRQLRQQMMFYAAGQMEVLIEGHDSITLGTVNSDPFNNFEVKIMEPKPIISSNSAAVLEQVTVTVSLKDSPTKPEPVTLTTYRLRAR
jgi:prepilin-type N-terminal cleavage/methylation domain-containing protein